VKNLGKNKSYINYSYRVKHPHPYEGRLRVGGGVNKGGKGYLIYFNEKQWKMKV
jgi:hypothetical protein